LHVVNSNNLLNQHYVQDATWKANAQKNRN